MVLNLSSYDNLTNVASMVTVTNDGTNGLFFALMLVVIWLVVLLASRAAGFKAALTGASFITSVVGSIMFVMGGISLHIVIFPILLFALSLLLWVVNSG